MKVIFLDIDGVLNNCPRDATDNEARQRFGLIGELSNENISAFNVGWDRNNLEALQFIIDQTGAAVVISSSWRILFEDEFFPKFFAAFDMCPNILGSTPRTRRGFRGDEVNEWLQTTNVVVDSHVILDDDSDFHEGQPHVHTDIEFGLTMELAQRAVDILNERNN